MENVLSVLVRHNPGVGGYDVVREWLNCEHTNREAQMAIARY